MTENATAHRDAHIAPPEDLNAQSLDQVVGGGHAVGSRSSGAGAGKITFNPFSITRKVDKASP